MRGEMPAASISPPRGGRSSRGAPAKARRASAGKARPAPGGRVAWTRLGRMAMLSVLAVLVYLYVSGGVRMLSTWKEARGDRSTVATLAREHAALVHEHESLGRQGTIEGEARRLGMMRKGEQQYIVTGLPHN